MQRFFFRLLLLTTSLSIFSATLAAIPWPVLAGDTHHQIGNTYGQYQSYESIGGINPFLHTGMDIMVPAGTPVYAVKSGYVKAVLTTGYEYHWRVAIGDSAGEAECDGWMYAHLDPNSITVYESEWVEQGRYLGNVIAWSVYDFNHLHFAKIRDAGYFWSGD